MLCMKYSFNHHGISARYAAALVSLNTETLKHKDIKNLAQDHPSEALWGIAPTQSPCHHRDPPKTTGNLWKPMQQNEIEGKKVMIQEKETHLDEEDTERLRG